LKIGMAISAGHCYCRWAWSGIPLGELERCGIEALERWTAIRSVRPGTECNCAALEHSCLYELGVARCNRIDDHQPVQGYSLEWQNSPGRNCDMVIAAHHSPVQECAWVVTAAVPGIVEIEASPRTHRSARRSLPADSYWPEARSARESGLRSGMCCCYFLRNMVSSSLGFCLEPALLRPFLFQRSCRPETVVPSAELLVVGHRCLE